MSGSTSSIYAANALLDPNQAPSIYGAPASAYSAAPGFSTPPNALAPPSTPQPTTAAPQSPQMAVQQWANAQNKNAYGVDPTAPAGTQQLAVLAGAGFPMFGDPRTTMDYLAQLSQGTVTNPNITAQQALAQFQQMLAQQNNPGANPWGGSNPDAAAGRW